MNEYEKQANDFLKKTGTEFKAEFLKFDKHFHTDKEKRNIFKITLSNKRGEYNFNFGSSIVDSCQRVPEIDSKKLHKVYCGISIGEGKNKQYLSVEFKATKEELLNERLLLSKNKKVQKEWDEKASQLKKKVVGSNKYITLNLPPFRKILPSALSRTRIKLYENKVYADIQQDEIINPTSYDVLACLTKYDPETFEDFCANYGYDTDSISSLKVYESVVKEWENIQILFSDDEIEMLSEIQ